MRRLALLLFGGLMAAAAGLSSTYYAIEVKGGSRLYAIDKPVQKGKVVLFHRYPDGTYMSLSAGEVGKVETLAEAPEPDRHAPGETLYIGGLMAGPSAPLAPIAAAPPSDATYMDDGYGYGSSGWGWGGGGGYLPRPPGPVPPSRIGPNGFPILAPPGSPGSTPPPIGPNGFPVLSPQPPQVSPRNQSLAPAGAGAAPRHAPAPRPPQ